MASSAEASPVASNGREAAGAGPRSRTASASVGPATYAVASHGRSASRLAAITGVVNSPLTRRAAATSARNRGSAARPGSMTRTATRSPSCARPTNSPLPSSGSASWYGPADVGGTITLNPHSPWRLQPFPRIPILSNDRNSVYATQNRQSAMTRTAANRNDFGTARAYVGPRSGLAWGTIRPGTAREREGKGEPMSIRRSLALLAVPAAALALTATPAL